MKKKPMGRYISDLLKYKNFKINLKKIKTPKITIQKKHTGYFKGFKKIKIKNKIKIIKKTIFGMLPKTKKRKKIIKKLKI